MYNSLCSLEISWIRNKGAEESKERKWDKCCRDDDSEHCQIFIWSSSSSTAIFILWILIYNNHLWLDRPNIWFSVLRERFEICKGQYDSMICYHKMGCEVVALATNKWSPKYLISRASQSDDSVHIEEFRVFWLEFWFEFISLFSHW